MANVHLNPETIAPPLSYSQVVVSAPGRLVFVAGQVALDPDGALVGPGDLAAQARQVFRNVRAALEAAGAGVNDVVKLTTFVVGLDPSQRAPIAEARDEVLGFDPPPASTLVGVSALAREEFLIEVEAIAALGD